MALFQLDPQSIAARVRAAPGLVPRPSLAASVVRGIVGFACVSVAGFSPWLIFDLWLRRGSEGQLYLACTAVFVGLSGVFLHRLILGPGSLRRFYQLFTLAFVAYALVWIGCWMRLRGDAGSILGLLGGTAVMAAIFSYAFDAPRAFLKSFAALFLLNTLGYYAGGWFEGKLAIHHRPAAMLLWGVCYGAGFGAGLGLAFHFCQAGVRALLDKSHRIG
jgi:hypothetical protein